MMIFKLPQPRQILGIICGLAIFGFLIYKSWAVDHYQHNQYFADIRQTRTLDFELNQDVLKARYGMLTFYDVLDRSISAQKRIFRRLETIPRFVPAEGKAQLKQGWEEFRRSAQEKAQLVEELKTANAVLRNSTAYFPTVVSELVDDAAQSGTSRQEVIELNALLDQVLLYNLTNDPQMPPKIRRGMTAVRLLLPPDAPSHHQALVNSALAHAEIIVTYQPKVQSVVERILALPTNRQSLHFSERYEFLYQEALSTASIYRWILYLYSLIVISGIASFIIMTLRASAAALRVEQQRAELLLLNVLPETIADRLKKDRHAIADSFSEVTVLFADLVEFTKLAEKISAAELVNFLNTIFSEFDKLAEKYGLEKIKTIGDAYMVAGGLPNPHPDPAAAVAAMALDMLQVIERFNTEHQKEIGIRIGINTGPVVAGVIGIKKFIYDVWGDTVNTASRMESHGSRGQVHVSESTYLVLRDRFQFQGRGVIQVKGKGEMSTFFLVGMKSEEKTEMQQKVATGKLGSSTSVFRYLDAMDALTSSNMPKLPEE
ncbi:MAG: hypothetical protein K1Y36_22645 [Blastocatellia bacterium]|nr:hypothetical protein [Blastocatellia bacterium]